MEERDYHLLQKGRKLNGRYIIEDVLGEGGFGITYAGRDELLGVKVAVKEYYPQGIVVRNNSVDDVVTVTYAKQKDIFAKGKARFLDEARVIAKFNDQEGIVNVTDFFEANNTAYIVMEYLDGITLKEYIAENGILSPEDILELMAPVLESLDEVHKQGLIHRDISPDNIMLLKNGKVKLMDFGAARDYTDFGEKSLSIVLKPGYAPEEQYRSRGIQGPWTDIYALSATIYKCITGITPEESMQRVIEDSLEKPSKYCKDIPKGMENAIMKGMAALQKNRYQNLKEFCEALYSDFEDAGEEKNRPDLKAEGVAGSENDRKGKERFNYNDSDTGNAKTQNTSKKPKLIAGAIILVVLLIFAGTRMSGGKKTDTDSSNVDYTKKSSQADTSEVKKDSSEVAEVTTQAAAATATTLSDKLEDYTFMLDGDVYQLPFAYSTIADKGWRIYTSGYYEDTKISGSAYEIITMQKDNKMIDVYVFNGSGNAKELKDCNIGGIQLYASNKIPEFSIAKGIKVGDGEDKVREAFGSPSDTNNSDAYNYLIYGEDPSVTTIVCDNGTDDYNDASIEIRNLIATEEEKKTETSDEVPEYLSTYVAPAELGTDPTSYNIEIDKQVYTLPAPVSAFTDNGWKIASQEDSVPSGRSLSYALKLQKDGKEMEVAVCNFAEYQTKPENCAVSSLYFYSGENNPEVKLPGGITLNSTSAALKKCVGDKFDYSKTGNSEYYDYYNDNGSIDISCEKTVTSIMIQNESWSSK